MIMNKSPKVSTSKTASKKYIIAALALVIILIVDVYVTGFMKFGYSTLRCGKTPVRILSTSLGWGGNTWYDLPGDYFPGDASAEYVCTEQEAIDRNIPKGI